MRHTHSLQFEPLEGRQLLSRGGTSASAKELAAEMNGGPIVLNGTLKVDMKAAESNMNDDESTTVSAPVSGTLGTLGKFTGFWNETTDSLGDLESPDVLRLRNSQGMLIIEFNNVTSGKAHPISKGIYYYQHVQALDMGTGAYAGDWENGSIEVVTSARSQAVTSLVLSSTNNT